MRKKTLTKPPKGLQAYFFFKTPEELLVHTRRTGADSSPSHSSPTHGESLLANSWPTSASVTNPRQQYDMWYCCTTISLPGKAACPRQRQCRRHAPSANAGAAWGRQCRRSVRTGAYIYIYIYLYIYIYIYTYICTHAHIYVYMIYNIHIYTHTYINNIHRETLPLIWTFWSGHCPKSDRRT